MGTGQFTQCVIPLYKAHPQVRAISPCNIDPTRLAAEAARFRIAKTYAQFDEILCDHDVDTVTLFTQRWMRAPMALAALEELTALVNAVKRTGKQEAILHGNHGIFPGVPEKTWRRV